MCGIFGQIEFGSNRADAGGLPAMGEVMARRGPDGSGIFVQNGLAFGHRRLKIIDLSDAAQQPMFDAALGLGIVYNGAIYNYPELRETLQGMGYSFFSTGDTEVLIKAYHAWGEDFVQRLNGMFAFAIWERDSGKVVLGRDRLGIKPLYFADTPGGFRFASTLPAILAGGGIDTDIDPVALHHYMTFHAVVPAPYTILKGVRKLSPGTMLTIEPGGARRERRYWSLAFGTREDERGLSEKDWEDRVLDALRLSVRRRLVADVPVGVLLSGGLDSSLIVGLLAEEGASGIETFSIGFESVGNELGNEFMYSDVVAERFGTSHHKLPVETDRVLPALPDCIAAMSEPMVSHDAVGFFLLSQEVAKHVKVVQSGQGADEIFAGYHWHPPMLESRDAVADYARVFFDRDHDEYKQAVDPRHHGDDYSTAFVRDHFASPGAERPIDKALRIDSTIMLVDDPVKRVDNMTMAWSLEARVPFLDHELVELAARVPPELKTAQGGKGVLKEAARRVVPADVIDRPKGYFPVPALKYLRGPYLDLVRDTVLSQRAQDRGLFQRDYVETLLDDPEGHITRLRGSKLWQVGLLEMWLQAQGV
ncbi:MAG: N-acetylglutaminylglutamine amidotransferase [Rhodospirillaceae bacterium]|nr:N-acetylglutaminylglutamine amidotransferase [Rhodospirillaceae bacterium]